MPAGRGPPAGRGQAGLPGEDDMKDRFLSNRAIGTLLLILTGLLLVYIWNQDWTHRVTRDRFLLGMMPLIGVGFMMLCAAGMIFDPLRHEVPETLQEARLSDLWLPPLMLAGVALCFWAMTRLGFLLATPPFLLGFMLWFGLRPARLAAILAVAVPAATWALFTALGVRLPRGMLAGLI
jgi:hypothetical protein